MMSDRQLLYYDFHKADKKCVEIAFKIKELYYPTAEDYVRCKKEIKADIMQMLCKEEQVTYEASEKSLHKRNKTPEEKALAAKRKQIQDRVKHLYNQIGKTAYGNDEYCRVADISNGSSSKNGANSPSPSTASTASLSTNSTPPSSLKELASPLTTSSAPTPSPINFNMMDNDEEFELNDNELVQDMHRIETAVPRYQNEYQSPSAGGGSTSIPKFTIPDKIAQDSRFKERSNPAYGVTNYLTNPFIIVIVGQTASGKSRFVGQIVESCNPRDGKFKTYENIWYVVPVSCPDCPVRATLQMIYGAKVFEGLESMPPLPTDNSNGTLLVIFDDMLGVSDKNKVIHSCFKMGRRVCSLIFVTQSYKSKDSDLSLYRRQIFYLAILPTMLPSDLKAITNDFGEGLDTATFKNIFHLFQGNSIESNGFLFCKKIILIYFLSACNINFIIFNNYLNR